CRCLLQNARIKLSIENNQRAPADMVLQLLRNIGPRWRTDQIIVTDGRCEQVPDMRSSYSSGAHPRGTS
ncbi:hypothetical protein SKA88_15545, partial [Enterococcus faecium]